MAVVIEYDGVGGYSKFNSAISLAIGDTITIKAKANSGNSGGNYRIIGREVDAANFVEMSAANINIRLNSQAINNMVSTGYTQPPVGTYFIFELERLSSVLYEVRLDAAVIGQISSTLDFLPDSIAAIRGDFYFAGRVEYVTNGSANNWDTNSSTHTAGNPVITDLIAANNATGVNMPTAALGQPGSAWIDEGGSGISIAPPSIISGESFGLPDVILSTTYLLPTTVSSLEAFGEALVLAGGVTLSPTSITSQESLGTPSVVYSQVILVDGITSEESFGIAIISDGVALVIPVGDRDTYQKIAEYLRTTDKFVSYQNNEILLEWLRSEGVDEGSFNDSFKEYWGQKGYVGAYNDRWKSWKVE
tara:strand:- start:2305 stop:3390 length:1086 start_codon:yes stop_codon:yes gene_type:complete